MNKCIAAFAGVLLLFCSSLAQTPSTELDYKGNIREKSLYDDSSVHVITIDPDSQVATVSGKEIKQLRERLKQAPDVPIEIAGSNVPVKISEARVRGVKREERIAGANNSTSMINDYAMSIRVTLLNEADKPVIGIGLQLTNTEAGHTFYVYRHHIFIGRGKTHEVDIEFMTVSGDPSRLSVQVIGGKLEDNRAWGSYPFPRPQPGSDSASSKDEVDVKPKLLNRPMPTYVVQARRNGVQGVFRAKIEIRADGSIGRIRVINALPDGLTESAIKAIRELRFRPAMKGGVAISHWQAIDVEFNMK